MMQTLQLANICVKKSPIHGYGVFAKNHIAKGEVIEEAYALLVDHEQGDLEDYYFKSPQEGKTLLVLGFGSIYNHADVPNSLHEFDQQKQVLRFYANKDILAGDEILISYGLKWFSQREVKARKLPLIYKIRKIFRIYRSSYRFLLFVIFCYLALQMMNIFPLHFA